MFKKFIASFLVFAIMWANTLVFFTKETHAQVNPWYKQSFGEWLTKVSDDSNPAEIFGERYTAAQVQWVVYGLIYMALNMTDDGGTVACLMNHGNNWFENCGVLLAGTFSKLSSYFQAEPPEEEESVGSVLLDKSMTVAYIRDVKDRITLVPEAKAQGFGFNAANPILEIWRVSRNMAYVLMVFVIIIMAFMIMFRVKLSPQTVITVQSALPRIVFTLIVITFSYAIGGLVIDLMYVIIGLFAALISSDPDNIARTTWPEAFRLLTGVSIFSHFFYYFIGFMTSLIINMFSTFALFAGLVAVVLLISIIIFLVLFLWKGIKSLFVLIKAFVNILLSIAFAPFILLGGALGMGGFGKWIKGLFANAIIFPVVGMMIFLSYIFLVSSFPESWPQEVSNLYTPFNIQMEALVNRAWDPPLLFGTQNSASRLLYLFTSFSIFMLIPKAADIIKSMVTGREFAYGTAIGAEAMGVGLLANRGVGMGASALGWRQRQAAEEQERQHLIAGGAGTTSSEYVAAVEKQRFERWQRRFQSLQGKIPTR